MTSEPLGETATITLRGSHKLRRRWRHFWFRGEKIRIGDLDMPEFSPPRCVHEAQLGEAAKRRLNSPLNAGSFSLSAGWRDQDEYGRKLRTVYRDGQSLGEILVSEGLARRWEDSRRSWCD
jgi:micrococcal nuclease